MAVFLKVLMIIGIVLLCILGLILLAVFLVLFVPVRYKANGTFKDNKPSFCAKVTWLLHIVSVRYRLGEEEPLSVRIFGIRLKKEKEEVPSFEDTDEEEYVPITTDNLPSSVKEDVSVPVSEDTLEEEAPESAPEPVTESIPESVPESVPTPTAEIHEEPKPATDHKFKKENAKKSSKHETENKDFENQSFCDKIKKYIEIIESKRFKTAFEYSKKKIFRLLKHILPRRIKVNGEVGFDDPSVTGQILVITSMMIPFFGEKVNIRGNFEEPVIDIEGMLKGRITIFTALWTLAVLYFNKNIRKIIKMFREV